MHQRYRLLILLTLLITIFPIEIIGEETGSLDQSITEKQEEIDELDQETERISEELVRMNVDLLEKDKELGQIQQDIDKAEREISETEQEIEQLNDEMQELEKRIEKREEIMGNRLRAMQQNDSNWGYIEVLLSSEGFLDFISKYTAVSTIIEQDQNIYQAQEDDLKDLTHIKEEISEQQNQLEQQLIDLEEDNENLAEQIDEMEQAEIRLEQELEANQLTLEQLEIEQEQLEKERQEEQQLALLSQEEPNNDRSGEDNTAQGDSRRPSNAPAGNTDSTFIWPTIGGVVTSYQGPRWGSFHKGIDIARPDDYSILAADGGIVTFSGWINGYGNTIEIDHQNGYTTQYAHLESKHVNVGQQVNQGDVIGIMGTTGRSTGIHLDFEVYYNGELLNPIDVLP